VLRFFMGDGAFTSDVMLQFCQGRQTCDECTMLSAKEKLWRGRQLWIAVAVVTMKHG
jgi:hypothetical protein